MPEPPAAQGSVASGATQQSVMDPMDPPPLAPSSRQTEEMTGTSVPGQEEPVSQLLGPDAQASLGVPSYKDGMVQAGSPKLGRSTKGTQQTQDLLAPATPTGHCRDGTPVKPNGQYGDDALLRQAPTPPRAQGSAANGATQHCLYCVPPEAVGPQLVGDATQAEPEGQSVPVSQAAWGHGSAVVPSH